MADFPFPATPPQTPGLPSNPELFVFEQFAGLNTKPLRPGIQDAEMSWCDGFMPIGPNNLRTLYGVGDGLYTATGSLTIVYYAFGNIDTTPYCFVFLSNGSVDQFNTGTGAITTVATAGTILNPSSNIGFCQWGSKYILFCADQTNGYWLWDGSNLFQAGTVGAQVVMLRSGEEYTSQPTIELTTTGSGTGSTFNANLKNNAIETIDVTNPGSGFGVTDFINLNISGGGSDNTAKATVTISNSGGVEAVYITNGGRFYGPFSQATATGGGGTGASFSLVNQNGVIVAINVVNPGTGYTSAPTITIANGGSGSTGFQGFATIFTGQITAVSVTNNGSGYKTPPEITVIGDGTGASLQAKINNLGQVASVEIVNGGRGYTKGLVHFSGGNKAAEAIVALMPFGVSGTTLEVYTNRVWVGNGFKGLFTAPSDPNNFNVSDGAGAFQSNDSFLRISYRSFKQSNGFLYLLADSSMNYISGVRTDGSPPITTYSNQNVDPQIGSPWPNSVQVFSRNVMFANSFGVHISYGGAVTKVSQALDGIYNTVANFGNFTPSSAVASIFGIQAYMLLLPVVDPISGQQANKLLMWDGKKWWTSGQDVELTFIATQEIDSVLTAWGTDGTSIYPLFQDPSAEFSKVAQSRLWANPNYMYTKTANRMYGMVNFNSAQGSGVTTIVVDNEGESTSGQVTVNSSLLTWTNNSGNTITWTNSLAQVITWGGIGLIIFGPVAVSNNGRLLGVTVTTDASDIALLSVTVLGEAWELRA